MPEILVGQDQNNVLPLVTWTGIFFLASKLHFILMTSSKSKRVQGAGIGPKAMTQFPPGEMPFRGGRLHN